MDYTTEINTRIGHRVVDLMKGTLPTAGKEAGIKEVETQLREILRQIGAAALGQDLSAQSSEVAPKIACACGGEMTYQWQSEASLISVFGRVSYPRSYYAGYQCGKGQAPLDQHVHKR